jgi:hypothetical protein
VRYFIHFSHPTLLWVCNSTSISWYTFHHFHHPTLHRLHVISCRWFSFRRLERQATTDKLPNSSASEFSGWAGCRTHFQALKAFYHENRWLTDQISGESMRSCDAGYPLQWWRVSGNSVWMPTRMRNAKSVLASSWRFQWTTKTD